MYITGHYHFPSPCLFIFNPLEGGRKNGSSRKCVALFSFLLNAQQGFDYGVSRLIARLFELGIVGEKDGVLPTRRSYDVACTKLPVAIVQQQLKKSHLSEHEANGRTFHGLKVLIPDGTKVSIANTQASREKYGAHPEESGCQGFVREEQYGQVAQSTSR